MSNNGRTVYIYEAIRRTKENAEIYGPRCIREVDWLGDEVETITRLKEKTVRYPGTWRIYRSVNKRDVNKAKVELAKTLIDSLIDKSGSDKSVESLWKTILCQPRNKAEKLWLVDVDDQPGINRDDVIKTLKELISGDFEIRPTINGCHIICQAFDSRNLPSGVSIHKDGLLFIERYVVP